MTTQRRVSPEIDLSEIEVLLQRADKVHRQVPHSLPVDLCKHNNSRYVLRSAGIVKYWKDDSTNQVTTRDEQVGSSQFLDLLRVNPDLIKSVGDNLHAYCKNPPVYKTTRDMYEC